jgi:hypothetical protein
MTIEERVALTDAEQGTLVAIADHLIPAAHGMPSAAQVLSPDRLRFVLNARPDLLEPIRRALGGTLGDDAAARLAALAVDDPAALGALQLAIVGATTRTRTSAT